MGFSARIRHARYGTRSAVSFLRGLRELPVASGLRTQIFAGISRRERRYLHDAAARVGARLDLLNLLEIFRGQSRDKTFFILGNGDSVNQLSQRAFDIIGENFSVGLNAWPLHDFKPTMYSFEFSNDSKPLDGELERLVARASLVNSDTGRVFLFLRPSAQKMPKVSQWLESLGAPNIVLYGRANLPTTRRANLDSDISQALRSLRSHSAEPVALDNGASVVRLISLALLAGVKTIVLAGVDFTGSNYFWYNSEFIDRCGDFRKSFPRTTADSDRTLNVDERPFSTLDFIVALAHVADRDYGAQILVATSDQALSQHLGVFDFCADL